MLAAAALAAAWSCTVGDDVTLTVAADLSYAVQLGSAPWLEYGDVALHAGGDPGVWLSASSGSLAPLAVHNHSGFDEALGAWVSLNVSWAGAPTAFDTQFVCWPGADLLEFRAVFPSGSPDGTSPGQISPDAAFYNLNLSHAASAHFPSFKLGPAAAASALGHVQWAGEFASHENNVGVSLAGFVGGELGGPFVLHDPSWERGGGAAGKPRAAVLGPLAGFKDSLSFIVPDVADPSSDAWRLVFGPHSHFDTLPRGFVSRFGLVAPRAARAVPSATAVFPGDTGITAAVYAYGSVLRKLARTKRYAPEADKGVSVVSAWTDNGGAYDGDWWAVTGRRGTGGETFAALRRGFDAMNLSVGSLQLGEHDCCAPGALALRACALAPRARARVQRACSTRTRARPARHDAVARIVVHPARIAHPPPPHTDPYWFSRGEPGYRDWLPSESIFGKDGFNETTRVFNTTL